MTPFRGTGALTRAFLLRTFRSRTALFWNFAFPLLWLFAFGYIFAGGTAEGVGYLMPGLLVITILAISFVGVSLRLVKARERGTLRRLRVTPVSALAVVLATAISSVALVALSLLSLGLTARLVFGVTTGAGLGDLVLILGAGAIAFVPIGLVVGSVAPTTESAPAINNALFFPLIFVTGAALPFAMLPEWVRALGRALPPTYLVEALQAVMVRGEPVIGVLGCVGVLLATGVVATAGAGALFRWESSEPIGRRRALGTMLVLALLLAAVYWLGPELGIAEQAPPRQLQLPGGSQ